MKSHLPTLVSGSWTIAGLRDSLQTVLAADIQGQNLALYFYAVTQSGWREVRNTLLAWRGRRSGRNISAYVGTDHGITEPDAIRAMAADGLKMWLLQNYSGIFHAKLVWLSAPGKNLVWIGSNNLTRDGLLKNIEFASLIASKRCPNQLKRWAVGVHEGSVKYSEALIAEYEAERRVYGPKRAKLGTFTWSRRERPQGLGVPLGGMPASRAGQSNQRKNLVVEIMPRETGQDGKQIQLPIEAAKTFFNLDGPVGKSNRITLVPEWTNDPRDLTMTIFPNRTVRLVIKELEYGDRPCVVVFRRQSATSFSFDIVSRATAPANYRRLLSICTEPTRKGSRRWGVV